jgi:serine/threonine protein kinase
MEQKGIVKEMADIQLNNYNPKSKYWQKADTQGSSSSSDSSSDEDGDVEEITDYHVDGYHPCHVGEIIDSKYVILKKLGWGHFSTVWLAFKLSDKQLYALKVQKSAEKYIESAFEEEEILYDVASKFKDPDWQAFLRKFYKNPGLEASIHITCRCLINSSTRASTESTS